MSLMKKLSEFMCWMVGHDYHKLKRPLVKDTKFSAWCQRCKTFVRKY